MARSESIIFGRYLVQGPSPSNVIEGGALYQRNGKIQEVGSYQDLRERHPESPAIGGQEFAVLPGLVNAHQHGKGMDRFSFGLLDEPLETWLIDRFETRADDVYLETLLAALSMVESGVTTTIHSHYYRQPGDYQKSIDSALRAYRDAGLRVMFATNIVDQNHLVYADDEELEPYLSEPILSFLEEVSRAGYAIPEDRYFEIFEGMITSQYPNESGRVSLGFAPVAPQWCSDGLLGRIQERARADNLPVHIHLLETPYQREYALRKFGYSIVEHLKNIGFLGPNVSCAHSVWVSSRDIEILRDLEVSIVHVPGSNLRLGSGIAPIAKMLQEGVILGLGTDGVSIGKSEDLFLEMRLASTLHRVPGDPSVWPSTEDIWSMVTVGGARAALLQDAVGQLVPGFRADAILLKLEQLVEPYVDPANGIVDALVYKGHPSDVDTVIVEGEIIYENGNFVSADRSEVMHELAENIHQKRPQRNQIAQELKRSVRRFYADWLNDLETSKPHYVLNAKNKL